MKPFFLILLVISQVVCAQEVPKLNKHGNMLWFGYYNSVSINKTLSIQSDIQYRSKDWLSPNQGLIRSGLQIKLEKKVYFAIGAAHFQYYSLVKPTRLEWRAWQEIQLRDSLWKSQITNRFRVEERYIESYIGKGTEEKYGFNFRFRHKVDIIFPLAKSNDLSISGTIGNEVMLNAGKNVKYNYFDQNRLSAGLLIGLSKNVSIQPQYIYIIQQLADGVTINRMNVLRLNIVHKL